MNQRKRMRPISKLPRLAVAFLVLLLLFTPRAWAADDHFTRTIPQGALSNGDYSELIKLLLDLERNKLLVNGDDKKMAQITLGPRLGTDRNLFLLSHVTTVQKLAISCSRNITDEGWENISRMESLRHLRVREIPFSKALLAAIQKLPELEAIELIFFRGFGNEEFRAIIRIKSLKRIDVSGNTLTNDILGLLEGAPKLENIRIYGTKITPQAVRLLSAKTRYRIRISGAEHVPTQKSIRENEQGEENTGKQNEPGE